MKNNRKNAIRFLGSGLMIFVLMNVVAYFHAYKFTHFAKNKLAKTRNARDLGIMDKLNALFFGINNPRPTNDVVPDQPFETIQLQGRKRIEAWHIKVPNSRGTVAIFHGYSGRKSGMLRQSEAFNQLGFSTFLIDFVGTGGSEGNGSTIGYFEAEDVAVAFNYLTEQQEKNIVLFGTSMGAVAIMKAARDHDINPVAAILECPFGTMYRTTCARFKSMRVPCFPMADLLVFWGGVQNGFWAFSHNPQEYAASVEFPTLLLYGEKDKEVSLEETEAIFENLKGEKWLRTFPEAAHENYLNKYAPEWNSYVSLFLDEFGQSPVLSHN